MQFRDFPHDRNGPSRNRQDARRAVPLGPQNAPSRDLASPRKTIHGSCQQQDGMRWLLLGQQHHASTGFKNRSPPESGRVTQAGTRREGNRRRAVAKLQASAANGMNRPLVPGSRRLSGESQKDRQCPIGGRHDRAVGCWSYGPPTFGAILSLGVIQPLRELRPPPFRSRPLHRDRQRLLLTNDDHQPLAAGDRRVE